MVALSHTEPETLEFSRRFAFGAVGDNVTRVEFRATAPECAALARRFELEGIESLAGSARLVRRGGDRVRVEVTFEVSVLQSCVVTLEPVTTVLSESFSVEFAATHARDGDEANGDVTIRDGEIDFDVSEPDPPEALDDGFIEFGESVAQHLSVVIDPYPRLADMAGEVGEVMDDENDPPRGDHPFAALARLGERH